MASDSVSEIIRPGSEREHIRVVAVIQARMTSAHPAGGVLKPIAGEPLLWHIVHRLKTCHLLEDIAVATTADPADEAIVEWCNAQDVTVLRGPADDVLARYAQVAEKLDADIIVRVPPDASLIDAGLVDHLVATLIEQDGDYVLQADGMGEAEEDVDAFSRRALDRLMMDAAHDPAARQHVTGYFKLYPDFVKIVRAGPCAASAKNIGRPDNLALVRTAHAVKASAKQRLNPPAGNTHSGRLALIRCDGGGKFGYGHVKRMVALARALRDGEGIGAHFALNGSEDADAAIRRAGFPVTMLRANCSLEAVIDANGPDILLLDGREGPDRMALKKLKRGIAVTAVIDDGHERRLACDYAYYPPVPGARALDWSGSSTVPRLGWEWSLLGLSSHAAPNRAPASRPTVLVAMGGSDPHGLTLRMAKALAVLDSLYRIRFVIGSGTKDAAGVARKLIALKKNYETVEGADDLSTEYVNADVALCAFGVTAYELAACGVPAIYLGLTEDHVASATAFADAGMGICLGLTDKACDADIARTVQWLLNKPSARREMREHGMALIDGRGAARIAADLAAALATARAPLKTAL